MSDSGRVRGANNLKVFMDFVNQHNQENNWHKFVSPSRKKIIRKMVCEECCFSRSALIQNQPLKIEFENLESDLRRRGIIQTDSLKQTDFEYSSQATFIKAFEDKLVQYKADINMLENIINELIMEINKLS